MLGANEVGVAIIAGLIKSKPLIIDRAILTKKTFEITTAT